MALLSNEERQSIWRQFMQDNVNSLGAITKSDLRAAVDALDSFLDTNAATINNAIPQPARAELTTAQKARLLAYVALRRWGG